MKRIVTMCRQGLCRSVAMADVLKMHFRPVDVIPIGHFANTRETIEMLCAWADHIIVMEEHYRKHVPEGVRGKVLVCDVGPDVNNPQGSKTKKLIDACWGWARQNCAVLEVEEHKDRL